MYPITLCVSVKPSESATYFYEMRVASPYPMRVGEKVYVTIEKARWSAVVDEVVHDTDKGSIWVGAMATGKLDE